jgi:type II secretory pathway pseudopilin PulG
MKIKQLFSAPRPLRRLMQAFSLVEVTVGMGVVGMSVAALFSGFTSGFFTIQMARENLRATQIMLEKMETIRLYSWDQINAPNFIPSGFTNYYDPNSSKKGVAYIGLMIITNAPVTSTYSNDMKQITVRVAWQTGGINRTREFTTYVARNGLQGYIY